ncbi:glycosyltransferase [Streptomyces sp. HUAS TT7]|uniref:glycosyltransferase n=1 Tax=Streptomyces sp. HUAS TT7 TaxID=3447507 RepID=UPI003F655096
MSRFLFVVPPLTGHINPAAAVAERLAAQGHTVAWVGESALIGRLVGQDAQVFAARCPSSSLLRPQEIRGVAALKFLWEAFLLPLAEATVPVVDDAVTSFRPDVLVVDQQAVGGAVAAERGGLVWATLATTSAEFTGALDGMPRVQEWIRDALTSLTLRTGASTGAGDLRFSPYLTLVCTTEELAGPIGSGPGPVELIGPAVPLTRPGQPWFPWPWLDPGRTTVLVSLGTANPGAGDRFLGVCRDAVKQRTDRVQAVLVDPRARPVHATDSPSRLDPDLLDVPAVPQLELLPYMGVVICHAGHNTVCEALLHGVPLVVAPIRDDQPVVAGQVVNAGAGVRVRFGRATTGQVGAALDAVLGGDDFTAGARRVQEAFRRAGGAAAAAARLERLAAGSPAIF